MPDKPTLEQEFSALDNARSSKIERARECSSITMPSLLPEAGHNETTDYVPPYSSAPARMVAALASKIVSTILPLNNLRYFEIATAEKVTKDVDPTELTARLSAKEADLVTKINDSNIRQMVYLALLHLIVVGDVLLCMYDNGSFQAHRLDNYVVERYGDGRVSKILLRQWVNRRALPEELKHFKEDTDNATGIFKWEPFYTKITHSIKDGKDLWTWTKEFRNESVGSSGEWTVNPYWALRWRANSAENYGCSLCEENIGDLRVLHGLSKAIIDGIAINSEFRWGVDPSGITEVTDLVDTDNCSFVAAREADLFPIQANTMVQVEQMHTIKDALEKSLGRIFLMESAVQPHQERVTATQIRSISNELEQSLTGVLPSLNQEMMQPIIRRKMFLEAKTDKELTEIFKLINQDIFSIKIRTGLEALGREMENSQIGSIIQQVLVMPPEAQAVINWGSLITRWFASTGINVTGLVLTQQEQDAKRAQMMQENMAAAGVQAGLDAAAKNGSTPAQ